MFLLRRALLVTASCEARMTTWNDRSLTDEYKFLGGERVQEMLAKDMIHLFRQHTRDPWSLEVGQVLWFAVDKAEKPGPAKTLAKMRIVPVVLSVTHGDDKSMRANGYSHKEVRRFKVARILKEAYSQNGVLFQSDVSELLGVSAGEVVAQTFSILHLCWMTPKISLEICQNPFHF